MLKLRINTLENDVQKAKELIAKYGSVLPKSSGFLQAAPRTRESARAERPPTALRRTTTHAPRYRPSTGSADGLSLFANAARTERVT